MVSNISNPERDASRASWKARVALVFSFPVMCAFMLAAVIFRYSIRGIAEPDMWWHFRNACTLLFSHSFSPIDTYSFTTYGSAWINFEWLSEIPLFLGFNFLGLRGLLLVYFVVLVVIFLAVYYRCCAAGANCKDAVLATLVAICCGGVSMAPRTLLFGWLCMIAMLVILDRFQRVRKGLWLLPLLFVLWINLHGSWVFGIAVLGITITSGLFGGQWGLVQARRWSSTEMRTLASVFALSIVALFVNPFGYKLVVYPFQLLSRPQGVMQYIDEWQPVDFSGWNGQLTLVLILSLMGIICISRLQWRLDEVALTSFALCSGLFHVRFLFFFGLVIAPILAPRLKLFDPYNPSIDKPWLNASLMTAVVILILIFMPSNSQLQAKIDASYPSAALAYIQANHLEGNIFNEYGWGGYMEWNAPQIKTFIDGRADIYIYNGTFRDFLEAMALRDSLAVLDKHNIDYVLLPPSEGLTYFLEHSALWRTVYSDSVAVLLQRPSSTH